MPSVLLVLLGLVVALASSCAPARDPASRGSHIDLPLAVLADTGATLSMPAAPWPAAAPQAEARATITRIAPTRAAIDAPLPDAVPAPPAAVSEERGGGLAIDDELQPPIPRGAVSLRMSAARRGWVELDVRVDERGDVSDAELFAASSADSGATAAAIEAALSMRFHPAMQRGVPVSVWSRQRFEFAPAPQRR